MKISFFETNENERSFFENNLKNKELSFFSEKLDKSNIDLIKDTEIISIFIYSKIDKEVLSKLSNLKAIITRSTGYDHIDISECKKKNISVLNVPSYGENTVAEHTFALILDLSRKIHESYDRTTKGNFSLDGLSGFDLKGKTLGIIGFGHIGSHVARIARGFEMKVLVYDIKKVNKKGIKDVSFEYLLKNSDIISLHCPYNKKTHHLINKNNINIIKQGSIIINTARGGLIETKSLVKALADKKIKGVGLDVLEEESIIREEVQLLSKNFPKENLENMLENHLLLTFNNCIITPHNAFNSKEALDRILEVSLINIKSVINKTKPVNKIK